jgi:hypothetical protein
MEQENNPKNERFGEVHEFHQGNYPQKLHVPEGMKYVEVTTVEDITAALREGLAVYGEGCKGKVFVWPLEQRNPDSFQADHFFLGPTTLHEFDDINEAADFAADLCE